MQPDADKRPHRMLKIKRGDCTLRLTPYRDNIIRVQYGPAATLDQPRDQTWIVAEPQVCAETVIEHAGTLSTLDVGRVRAIYDDASDRLRFGFGDDKLLAEPQAEARSLNVSDTPGSETWAIRQCLTLGKDESLYGLGQSPADSLRLNGRSLDLCQENPVIVVPMLLSSRGYGVFWNSAAHGALNRVTGPVPAACLADDTVERGGLTMRRYANTTFEGEASIQKAPTIDAEWRGARVEAWIDAGKENQPLLPFSVRWAGSLTPKESGTYTFKACFPDGCRVWIDDRLVLDSRGVHSWVNVDLPLQAERPHRIMVESVQPCDWRGAYARLWWSPPAPRDSFSLWSQTGECIDYFFIAGDNPDEVIAGYRTLTGRASMLPRWAFGLWQSKEHYRTADEVISVVEEYRKREIPLDVIVQDWRYWDPLPWGSMAFDPHRYPDPAGMVNELHERLNVRLLLSIWSDFHPASDTHARLEAEQLLLPNGFRNETQFIDMFKPEGRRAYWDIVGKRLGEFGVDAWWLDCTEPKFEHPLIADVLSRRLIGTGGESRGDRLNSYGLEASRAVYDGASHDYPDKRVTILNRSGFAGSQRYGTIVWSGDIYADWQTLREQVVAGLNCCAAGVPYWNSDIGGFFSGDPRDPAYAELFVRWFQFGCFCPITRIHGTNHAKEPWRFDARYAQIIEAFIRLRYELLPYIYSLAGHIWLTHGTMMRPLVMDFAGDATACAVNDQFMFGPAIMVCPVLEANAKSRRVYLPAACDWYDYWSGQRLTGGNLIEAETPLERLPLYVPAGAILPTCAVVQHTRELTGQPLNIRLFPGRDGTFSLYEDAGDGKGYEIGEYSLTTLRWSDANRCLTLGARQGRYPGMSSNCTYHLSLVDKHGASTTYEGEAIDICV
jgi:alpha-D-xyloside xylohydrolase